MNSSGSGRGVGGGPRPPHAVALLLAAVLCSVVPVAARQEGAPAGPPASTVLVKDGRLSVSLRTAKLTDVLARISADAGIAIVEVEDLSRFRISASFADLPLEEGLRRLLQNFDVFTFVGVGRTPPATLQAVWVYPRGRGRGVAPVPPQAWASTAELQQRLESSTDPGERATLLEEIIDRKGAGAIDAIRWALGDVDAQVRSRAVYAATSSGVELPGELLLQAMNDASRDVRFLALQALARGPQALAAATRARSDPDQLVRQEAEQILKRLAPAEAAPAR